MSWNIFHFMSCDKIIVIRKVIVTIYQSCAVLKHIICIIYLIFTILLRFDSPFAKWENWKCSWSEPSIMSTWLQSFCLYHYAMVPPNVSVPVYYIFWILSIPWCEWPLLPHWSPWLSSILTTVTGIFLKSILVHVNTLLFKELSQNSLIGHFWVLYHSPTTHSPVSALSIPPCFDTSFYLLTHLMSYPYWISPTSLCFFSPRLLLPMPPLPRALSLTLGLANSPPLPSLALQLRHHFSFLKHLMLL